MKKYLNPVSIVFALSILVSILFIITLFSTLTANDYIIFFNSDTLYLPYLFKDLFVYHSGIQGWHFNPSPNFFPDMPVYFIIMFFTNDFIVASFLYPILQYIVYLILILKLFQLVLKSHAVLFASFSNVILLVFFLVTYFSHDFDFTFYIISTSYHISAFLMALLCIILTIQYLENPKKSLLINLAWIGILGIISDRLFVVMYCLPILFLILLYKKIFPVKKLKLIFIVNISVFFLGAVIFIILKNNKYISIDRPHRIMDFNNSANSFRVLSGHMHYYLKYGTYTRLIVVASFLSFLSTIYMLIKGIKNEQILSAFTIYCYFSVIFTLIVFFAPVINGNYTASDSLRYNIYVFYLSMLNIPLVIAYFLKGKFKEEILRKVLSLFLLACLIVAFWIGFSKISVAGLQNYFHYYPDKAKQIDKIANEHKLLYGVGNYWSAKYLTMFSKSGVRILPVFDDLCPYYHASNKNWYFAKNSVFNYILLYKFEDKEKYKSLLGTSGIKADSSDLETILVPEFRFDPLTLKVLLVTDSRVK